MLCGQLSQFVFTDPQLGRRGADDTGVASQTVADGLLLRCGNHFRQGACGSKRRQSQVGNDNGMTHARARATGPDAEIAVIEAPLSDASRLAALADRIRGLGFRYVALDLGSDLAR
jgi:hypothetical protein